MPLQDDFNKAVNDVQELNYKPSNEDLLLLYGLYKQATNGDIKGDSPGGFDFKEAAKYNSWAKLKGKTKEEAMEEYVELVNKLKNP